MNFVATATEFILWLWMYFSVLLSVLNLSIKNFYNIITVLLWVSIRSLFCNHTHFSPTTQNITLSRNEFHYRKQNEFLANSACVYIAVMSIRKTWIHFFPHAASSLDILIKFYLDKIFHHLGCGMLCSTERWVSEHVSNLLHQNYLTYPGSDTKSLLLPLSVITEGQ